MLLKNRFLKVVLFTLPILAIASPAGEPVYAIASSLVNSSAVRIVGLIANW